MPDIAVVPEELARGGGALLPDQTFLVVEVTSESNAESDRIVKRRRYAEYRAPLYLLVDRIEGSITLFSEPGHLGYTRVDPPAPVRCDGTTAGPVQPGPGHQRPIAGLSLSR